MVDQVPPDGAGATSADLTAAEVLLPDGEQSRAKAIRRIVVRVVVIVVVLGLTSWLLLNIFDDLDPDEIRDALARLNDAEWLSLIFGWLVWVVAQGALTASLVDKLPVRRGVQASLGPTAVSSVIPGPSDLPVRFAMYQSWGVSSTEAATAVAASGIFSVSSQLILPSIAGLIIFFANVPLSGFLNVIVVAALALGALVTLAGITLGSEKGTEWAGRKLDGPVRRVARIVRKEVPEQNLGELFVEKRAEAFGHLRDKWLMTSLATVVTVATKCALLIMALRFVGIPEDELGWLAIFAVYGLVAGLTAIPITPGAAGVAEIGYVGMLTTVAGQEWVNEVTAGVLLFRLMTWILIIPVGFGVLGVWRHGVSVTARAEREAAADDVPGEATAAVDAD